jgi:class 3 adenylate cyclase
VRKLAAILAADVVGYSRLMGEDEAGTLARLKEHRRELIDPKISEHKGRIVKTTGDGILIEFPSVVEAVACAVAVPSPTSRRSRRNGSRRPERDPHRSTRRPAEMTESGRIRSLLDRGLTIFA